MTCDEAIKKIRKYVLRGQNAQRASAYMKILEEMEKVIREHYLDGGEQIRLLKSDPQEWNRWLCCLLSERTERESNDVSPYYVLQCMGGILIQLQGANFDRCDLSPIAVKHADMTGCSFKNANLEGSYFHDCDFDKVSFKGANLSHAGLWLSSFHSVDFDEADLRYAVGDVFFYWGIRLGRACVKHNALSVTNYDIVPRRGSEDKDLHKHSMSGRIIQDGGDAKFFPFKDVLYDVDVLVER